MKSTCSCIRIGLAVLFWTVALPRISAADDEYDQFTLAKNAFDGGDYQEAVRRFDTLLKGGLQNTTLILETLKLSGVSYLFIGNKEAAEEQFTELLTRSPDSTLDPLLYPIEVVDFFTKIKQKNQKQLDELAKAKAIEEKARQAAEEKARKAEFERMRRNVYLEKNVSKRSLLVAVLPFGVGQFQNGQKVKGWAFFSAELLLSTSATVFYFLHSSLRTKANLPFIDPAEKEKYIRLEQTYRLTNHISLIALGVTVIAGIVDSLLYYQTEKVDWKRIDEEEVPVNLRPGNKHTNISFDLFGDRDCFGVGLTGRF